MRIVLQRVSEAAVAVSGETVGRIGPGLLALVCAERGDTEAEADYFAAKTAKLRVFMDDAGKTNLSLDDVGGAVLAISQFTLAADWRKGNRPGFSGAEAPDRARALFGRYCDALAAAGIAVETGRFGAEMRVSLVNEGPFTLVLEGLAPDRAQAR